MRLLVDECMPRLLVERLRAAGHDVTWAAEYAAGEQDRDLLARSASEDRVSISRDQDFGELVFGQSRAAVGVLFVALGSAARKESIAERVTEIVATFGERLRGRYTTAERDRARQRDLPGGADRL